MADARTHDRIYWLGFAVMLKRVMHIRGHSASVLASLVRAQGRPVRADTFEAFSRGNGQLLSKSSAKPAVALARGALDDLGLGARIVCERGEKGDALPFYRLEGWAEVRALIEEPTR